MSSINEVGSDADIQRLQAAAQALDPDVAEQVQNITDVLDELSSILAKSDGVR